MKLYNTIFTKSKYSGKSKFSFWNNLGPGIELVISMKLENPGHGRTLYATKINFHNTNTGEDFACSLTEAAKYLDKIEYLSVK